MNSSGAQSFHSSCFKLFNTLNNPLHLGLDDKRFFRHCLKFMSFVVEIRIELI